MKDSYVTMYAKLTCSKGCMENYLNVGTDHGVYKINDNGECYPVMNANDNKVSENIPKFGMCCSEINPEYLAMSGPQKAAAKAKNLVTKDGLCGCNPKVLTTWYDANTTNQLDGKDCLTVGSKLACAYGGIISIVDKKEGK